MANVHRRAEKTQLRAAGVHEQAARLYEEHGHGESAKAERRFADRDRQPADVETDRATRERHSRDRHLLALKRRVVELLNRERPA